MEMLLEDKNAIVYGGGGAVGGAVARTFAREGANIFLAGTASDDASAMTGIIANVTCGYIVD
jgi:NAD(P)-dependent dehydrogenase (short-subunit alcohol dehydrogenase family)